MIASYKRALTVLLTILVTIAFPVSSLEYDKSNLRLTPKETPNRRAENIDSSNSTAPHQGCLLLLNDHIPNQEKLVGEHYEQVTITNYRAENEASATSATCSIGLAGGYPCNKVDLLSMLDNAALMVSLPGSSDKLNDIWGWTDTDSGREFALVGLSSGTAFVEITNVNNPVYLGGLPTKTASSNWRDIKTIGNYAVIVSEASNHGMQIFDLTQLLTSSSESPVTFQESYHYSEFGNAHNVFVTEDTGYVYVVGSNKCGGGLYIVDMNDPTNPVEAGCFSNDGYTHDVQCVLYAGPDSEYVGREICFASNEDTLTIVDVGDKADITQLSKKGYGNAKYTHQGWLTEDHTHFIFNDELDELRGVTSKTRTHVMDVSDLNNPTYAGYHDGRTSAIDHNLYVKGDLVYQANYRAGLNVLKIVDAGTAEFEEVGYFDIFPSSDSTSFNGAWSNYPYFPSGNVIVSGIEQGLFVLKFSTLTSPPTPTSSPTPPPPTSSPTPSPTPVPCTSSEGKFSLSLLTDNYSEETSWSVKRDGVTVLSKNPSDFGDNIRYEVDECLACDASYTFTLSDAYGDGICCNYGVGEYEVKWIRGPGDILSKSGGDFLSEDTFSFSGCADNSPAPTPAPITTPPTTPAPTVPAPTTPVPTTVSPTSAPTLTPIPVAKVRVDKPSLTRNRNLEAVVACSDLNAQFLADEMYTALTVNPSDTDCFSVTKVIATLVTDTGTACTFDCAAGIDRNPACDINDDNALNALRSNAGAVADFEFKDGEDNIVAQVGAVEIYTNMPSSVPSLSSSPSFVPSLVPSSSSSPSEYPTNLPTIKPTSAPSNAPSNAPMSIPTNAPTSARTSPPTNIPTSLPTSKAPSSTLLPTKQFPTTETPTTASPTTPEPTTVSPTTTVPTTALPTTSSPTTDSPTTSFPTGLPTTISPTPIPTSAYPTTSLPTTATPTASRITISPTTLLPTMSIPTTPPSSSLAPSSPPVPSTKSKKKSKSPKDAKLTKKNKSSKTAMEAIPL